MDAKIMNAFDEAFKVVEANLFASDFDEVCDKISNLARDLWFNHEAISFEELSDINHRIFKLRCRKMDTEFNIRSAFNHAGIDVDQLRATLALVKA